MPQIVKSILTFRNRDDSEFGTVKIKYSFDENASSIIKSTVSIVSFSYRKVFTNNYFEFSDLIGSK